MENIIAHITDAKKRPSAKFLPMAALSAFVCNALSGIFSGALCLKKNGKSFLLSVLFLIFHFLEYLIDLCLCEVASRAGLLRAGAIIILAGRKAEYHSKSQNNRKKSLHIQIPC